MLSMLRARASASVWRAFASTATPPSLKKSRPARGRFTVVGMPLLLFVVGGYVLLTQFVAGKYEARDHLMKSQTTRAFDLEQEHKRMTEKLALDQLELKRVPRPDEEQK